MATNQWELGTPGVSSVASWDNTASTSVNTVQHQFKGQLLKAQLHYTGHFSDNQMDIKKQLAQLLVSELMSAKHISFTKQVDPKDPTSTVYRAYMYVLPDSDVFIIKELK